jgi:hypothetical protein
MKQVIMERSMLQGTEEDFQPTAAYKSMNIASNLSNSLEVGTSPMKPTSETTVVYPTPTLQPLGKSGIREFN